MLSILFTAFLLVCSSHGDKVDLDGDANIYEYAKSAVEEVKLHKLAYKLGISRSHPSILQRAQSVCYDDLGCFDKDGTFKHLKTLPEPPETVNTKFLLYTRKNLVVPQFLDYKDVSTVLKSNLNPSHPLKFITHGFGGKNNLTWVWNMKSALLEAEEVNVIVIDWSLGARVPYYIQAAVNTELVGAEAAVLYYRIKDKLGIQEKDLHLIGFSLGAHVVGFIGKRMQELRGTKPGRITGLDPASPLFEDEDENVHLSKNDAEFVDVVHTNADLLMYGGVGIEKPIGHVDYYPNGGKRQPGCPSTIKGIFFDIFKNLRERVCNHERAVHLFTDSVLNRTPCEYTAYRCENYKDFELGKCMSCSDTCGRMGYKSHGNGIYYLMTKAETPYCAGLAKLTVKFPATVKKSYGSMILTFVGKNGEKENVTLTEKDEKLSPGGGKFQAMPISDIVGQLDSVQALYLRYNGFFTKGKETFGIASVTIQDSDDKYIFKSCADPVILTDQQYHTLKQTEASC
ncbi:pancreatic lipase-related protein 2 isoform X1 [Parasteatoda tepidariorum]|uniref:pancreatic lipase-related protein 2 isoform X1 n=2 Tax=Parasteatoda tepidariorum TaxID=114398 RepID=UPI0039BD13DA